MFPLKLLWILVTPSLFLRGVSGADCRATGICINGQECNMTTGQCDCYPGWTGPLCTIRSTISPCSSNPCKHGTCHADPNTRDGFSCFCDLRFQGELCDDDKDECGFMVCGAGGTCKNRTPDASIPDDPGFYCECPPDRAGDRCQYAVDLCKQTFTNEKEELVPYCLNGGECEVSTCACPDGWSGARCERAVPFERELFDSGCVSSPATAAYCRSRFHDGKCDMVCASEACLFDGFDCIRTDARQNETSPRACRESSYCSRFYADGRCNKECNEAECGWDGGDCETKGALPHSLDSQLIGISVLVPPTVALFNLRLIQSELGQRLYNSHVTISSDRWGELVFEWDPDADKTTSEPDDPSPSSHIADTSSEMSGLGRRVPIDIEKREFIEGNFSAFAGTMIFFDIDTGSCRRRKAKARERRLDVVEPINCFEDVYLAARFLSIELARSQVVVGGVLPISSVRVVSREAPSWRYAVPWAILAAAVVLILIWIGVFLVIVRVRKRKQKMVNAPIWTVPSDNEFAFHPPTPPYHMDSPANSPSHYSDISDTKDPMLAKRRRICDSVYPPPVSEDPPLLMAVRRGDVEAVEEMITSLEHIIDAVDGQGLGAIHHAIANNDAAMLRMLIRSGEFDIFDRNALGQSPLVYAARVGHPQLDCYALIIQTISEQRARRSGERDSQESASIEEKQTRQTVAGGSLRSTINVRHSHPSSLLLHPHTSSPLPLSNEHQLEWSLVDNSGRNCVHYAAVNNLPQLIHYLSAYGADINRVDSEGNTPLHLSSKVGHIEAIVALLDCKANPNVMDAEDRTPAQLAEQRCQYPVLELFNERMYRQVPVTPLSRSLSRIKRPRVIYPPPSSSSFSARDRPQPPPRLDSDGYYSMDSATEKTDSLSRSTNALTVPLMDGPPSLLDQMRRESEMNGIAWRSSTPSMLERGDLQRAMDIASGSVRSQRSQNSGRGPPLPHILTPPSQVLGMGGCSPFQSHTLPAGMPVMMMPPPHTSSSSCCSESGYSAVEGTHSVYTPGPAGYFYQNGDLSSGMDPIYEMHSPATCSSSSFRGPPLQMTSTSNSHSIYSSLHHQNHYAAPSGASSSDRGSCASPVSLPPPMYTFKPVA